MSLRRWLANILTSLLPPTRAYRVKARLWRLGGVVVAPTARLVSSVRIWTSGVVVIGHDTFLGHEVLIAGGSAEIRIGDRCDVAPRVSFVGGTHLDGGMERAAGAGVSRPIRVGDGVWIGAGCTILGGVEIGHGAVVGAGSLVNRSIPPMVVAVGVPCRVIGSRDLTPHQSNQPK